MEYIEKKRKQQFKYNYLINFPLKIDSIETHLFKNDIIGILTMTHQKFFQRNI